MLYGIFSGRATLVEVAAAAAAYTLFTEFIIHRDLKISVDLAGIFKECAIMVGGIMIILASAMGLTSYLIYADVPSMAAELIQSIPPNIGWLPAPPPLVCRGRNPPDRLVRLLPGLVPRQHPLLAILDEGDQALRHDEDA